MDNEFEKQQPENPMPEQADTVPQGNEDNFQQNTGNYQQYNYQPNQQYNYGQGSPSDQQADDMDTRPLTMGEWLLTLFALCIPCCVGIVLYIIWAFSKKGNVNRRNFCRAALIVMLVLGVLYFVLMSVLGGALYSMMLSSGI